MSERRTKHDQGECRCGHMMFCANDRAEEPRPEPAGVPKCCGCRRTDTVSLQWVCARCGFRYDASAVQERVRELEEALLGLMAAVSDCGHDCRQVDVLTALSAARAALEPERPE
jgi:hypothetical protein